MANGTSAWAHRAVNKMVDASNGSGTPVNGSSPLSRDAGKALRARPSCTRREMAGRCPDSWSPEFPMVVAYRIALYSSTAALTVLHQSLSKVQARQGEDMHEDLWFDLHHRNDQVIRIKLVLRL